MRDVETGGEPTPIEEPIRFEMNLSRTAFRVYKTQKLLFDSVQLNGEQDHFKFPINDSFLDQ